MLFDLFICSEVDIQGRDGYGDDGEESAWIWKSDIDTDLIVIYSVQDALQSPDNQPVQQSASITYSQVILAPAFGNKAWEANRFDQAFLVAGCLAKGANGAISSY